MWHTPRFPGRILVSPRDRGPTRSRRPSHRRRSAVFRLERLEGRNLLSGITGVAEFPIPTPSANPFSIAKGPDGNLWFVERTANKIGMINPTTHAVSEFAVPTSNAGLWDIAAGPDGNVWFINSPLAYVTTPAIGVLKISNTASSPTPSQSGTVNVSAAFRR